MLQPLKLARVAEGLDKPRVQSPTKGRRPDHKHWGEETPKPKSLLSKRRNRALVSIVQETILSGLAQNSEISP